jgi:light-regulated signal transduction histidine kinase (bacteriophytochrome)
MRAWRAAVDTGTDFEAEFRLRRHDGVYRWFNGRAIPLRDVGGRITKWLGSNSDVHEAHEMRETLQKLNVELEQRVQERTAELQASNRELESFSYSVSHDLRAPLRHMSGFIKLLRKHTGSTLDAEASRYLDIVFESSQRLGNLIDDLLEFSRAGRRDMRKEPVDFNALLRDVINELQTEAAGRHIDWQVASLPQVRGDNELLRAVLTNLVGNALKFTRTRDPARIQVGCIEGDRGLVTVYIRDNGVGFNPAYTSKLFGVFQRLHHASDFEGSGIGLANVRRIVERHGGKVWAEGAIDRGATFYLSLPAVAQRKRA